MATPAVGKCVSGIQGQRMGQVLDRAVVVAQRTERHASQNIPLCVVGVALDRLIEVPQAPASFIEFLIRKTAQGSDTIQVGIEYHDAIKVGDGPLVVFEVSVGDPSMGVGVGVVGVQRQRAGQILDGFPILAQSGRGNAPEKIGSAIGGIKRERLVKVCDGPLQFAAHEVRRAPLAIEAREQRRWKCRSAARPLNQSIGRVQKLLACQVGLEIVQQLPGKRSGTSVHQTLRRFLYTRAKERDVYFPVLCRVSNRQALLDRTRVAGVVRQAEQLEDERPSQFQPAR